MRYEIFIYAGFLLLFFYLMAPVPHCKITEEDFSLKEAIYSESEVSEVKNITITLLNVKGSSMFPTILNNSKCLCIKKDNYKVGDIIFFFAKINEEWEGISHRIFSIEKEKIFTKGDNNNWVDPPLSKENIVCAIPTKPRYRVIF